MTVSIFSPRLLLAAAALSTLGLVAVDTRPAEAVVVCRAGAGCVAGRPMVRAAVVAPGVVGRGVVGRGAVGGPRRFNRGGPVNRVGFR